MIPVILFSGYSNSGKTTVIESVVSRLVGRGYDITTLKHHRGDFDIGEGQDKDSSRHMRAGARRVILSSDTQYIDIKKIAKEKSLEEIIRKIVDTDLIVVEGYKNTNYPKIEVYRRELGFNKLDRSKQVFARVTDDKIEDNIPSFEFKDMEKLSLFIEDNFLRVRDKEVLSC